MACICIDRILARARLLQPIAYFTMKYNGKSFEVNLGTSYNALFSVELFLGRSVSDKEIMIFCGQLFNKMFINAGLCQNCLCEHCLCELVLSMSFDIILHDPHQLQSLHSRVVSNTGKKYCNCNSNSNTWWKQEI